MYEMPTLEDLLLLVSKTMLVPSSEHSEHFLFTMEEIWKDVVGYEGYYQVSNLGRVKGLPRRINRGNNSGYYVEGKILKNYRDKLGYLRCCLSNGKHNFFLVHRLVAIAFIPNPNNLPYINHKDENPSNNRIDNLEWCTQKYNVNYGTAKEKIIKTRRKRYDLKELANKAIRTRTKNGCLNGERAVLQYDSNGNFICKYDSAVKAANAMGVSPSSIRRCCELSIHSVKGYIYIYESDKCDINERIKFKNKHFRPVSMYKDDVLVKTWDKSIDAAKELGLSFRTISSICLGHKKQQNGFSLKFSERI